jgi:hypothetical protein
VMLLWLEVLVSPCKLRKCKQTCVYIAVLFCSDANVTFAALHIHYSSREQKHK